MSKLIYSYLVVVFFIFYFFLFLQFPELKFLQVLSRILILLIDVTLISMKAKWLVNSTLCDISWSHLPIKSLNDLKIQSVWKGWPELCGRSAISWLNSHIMKYDLILILYLLIFFSLILKRRQSMISCFDCIISSLLEKKVQFCLFLFFSRLNSVSFWSVFTKML